MLMNAFVSGVLSGLALRCLFVGDLLGAVIFAVPAAFFYRRAVRQEV